MRVTATSEDRADALLVDVCKRAEAAISDKTPIRIWNSKRGGTYDDQLVASPSWETISRNYPARVREQLTSLVTTSPGTKSSARLILWNGEPGTGKTTAIRSLAREWASWCSLQYISDPEQLFTDSAYLNEVLDEPARQPTGPTFTSASKPDETWRVLVAEDTDEFLRPIHAIRPTRRSLVC